ncbi:MAG TPA: CHASE4 domain-containing protein, partial [Candidatus Dormibacteraeota bacterium]|nr:CHASE4 domain-containing protein [Candidatus Dormibacteraeota bacterium]
AVLLVEKNVLLPSFAELERSSAQVAMRRISYQLDLALDRLAVSATDWGNWADTYRFVVDHNAEFVSANVTLLALRQLNVNLLMIIGLDGNVVISSTLDPGLEQPLKLDLAALKALPEDFPWRANLREGGRSKGLLTTNSGVLLLAASPVLDGNGGGPARGMVIMGRLLSPEEVARIGAQAQADLALLPPVGRGGEERLLADDAVTHVYRTFADLYGRPAMTLRVDLPREVTARGHAAVALATACLAGAAVGVLIVLVIVLNRLILKPLAVVTRHAVAVGQDEDLTTRLDSQRRDEIGVLAREFDRMVARVAESRTQLVDQSFQAGFAELAKGVLHNLGNAMTPIGVRLATLGQRLRGAPAADAEQAVTELQSGAGADPQRQADLEQFLRLACKELAAAVRSAAADVEVMTRQANLVQNTLSEQMRSARNEQVIEPVRLTDLVAQSLEIVPDSCRQRLVIDTDETLRRLGVVRVARTVLRLILQNLIINAADAVRDAGKDKGVLHVTAEIVQEGAREELHLRCQDNGVGIPAANLERVFEKGFSTKSAETNHGIGLHWCANAINALGGRIWAASDGPGCGTSMHLIVPLAERDVLPLAGVAA